MHTLSVYIHRSVLRCMCCLLLGYVPLRMPEHRADTCMRVLLCVRLVWAAFKGTSALLVCYSTGVAAKAVVTCWQCGVWLRKCRVWQ
jgi:hypothetical protein